MKNISEKNLETKIEEVLNKVRPFINSHGGDIAVSKINGTIVIFKVSGRCAHCQLADLTFNHAVRGMVKECAPEVTEIIFENAYSL